MEETTSSENHPQSVEVEWSDEDESLQGVSILINLYDELL